MIEDQRQPNQPDDQGQGGLEDLDEKIGAILQLIEGTHPEKGPEQSRAEVMSGSYR